MQIGDNKKVQGYTCILRYTSLHQRRKPDFSIWDEYPADFNPNSEPRCKCAVHLAFSL